MKEDLRVTGAEGLTSLRPEGRSEITSLLDDLGLLWVSGLALLLIVLVSKWSGLHGYAREWAAYLTLGTLFPALLLLMARWRPAGGRALRLVELLKLGLAACCALAVAWFFVASKSRFVVVLAGLEWAAMLAVMRFSDRRESQGNLWAALAWGLATLFVTTAAWIGSAYLLHWTSFRTWITGCHYTLALFLLSFLLVLVNFFYEKGAPRPASPILRYGGSLVALVILGLASLRSDHLFECAAYHHWSVQGYVAYHHWGVFVGPAQMVRQGGWLLWDVPSQYGFLSILTLAAIPAKTVWQAFYFADAMALFVSASLLCFLPLLC